MTSENHELKTIMGQLSTNLKGLTNTCQKASEIFTKREASASPEQLVNRKANEPEREHRRIVRSRERGLSEVEEPSAKRPRLGGLT